MVKVLGPMMSMQASGTLADTITFSSWKGRPYVRERVIPSNPRSGAQVGRRAVFKWLTQEWATIGASAQATWQTIADQLVASPFNAMISDNMKNWHNFIAPCTYYPPDRAATVAVIDDPADAEWIQNRIQLAIEITTQNQNKGVLIFASATAAFTPAVGNCILCETLIDVAEHIFYWTPPTVGTWYFNVRCFTTDGLIGAAQTEFNAAP